VARAKPDRVEVLRLELGKFERERLDGFLAAQTAGSLIDSGVSLLDTIFGALKDNSFLLLVWLWLAKYGIDVTRPTEDTDPANWIESTLAIIADASEVAEAYEAGDYAGVGVEAGEFYISWLTPIGLWRLFKGGGLSGI